ncbi:MAG: lipid-binding SYLF domain-containing protein, partial [Gammaproteobacteria bacterium]|nr:lipid-binding SYLF domain-containing protein [Gammaproteobacteria bacterium]
MGRLKLFAAAALSLLLATTAAAATSPAERISDATNVLSDFTKIPEQGIPGSILSEAYGVAVIPGMAKLGAVIGGRFGKGILVVRKEDGSWSNPAFISLGGGSIGWQFGAQSSDLILVFRSPRSVERIADGTFTLGGDASIAAGPVGRSSMAATDQRLKAEIFSYSRSRGLFAGIALDGSWLRMDEQANADYYGVALSPSQILAAGSMATPLGATEFVEMLARTAPRI